MVRIRKSSEAVERIIGGGCARNSPAELHYESREGVIITARVRLLKLTERQVLVDRPIYLEDDGQIPAKAAIRVHMSHRGAWHEFDSVIEEVDLRVPLNRRQTVPGVALRKPAIIKDSQRRSHLRISMVGYDPISVDLVRPHPDVPGACPIDAERISGWMLDLSVGGTSVLADRRVLASVPQRERFFVTFALPCVEDEFNMLASVRHTRVVEASDSIRLGIRFCPWQNRLLRHDQRRISRFIAEHERRLLCGRT